MEEPNGGVARGMVASGVGFGLALLGRSAVGVGVMAIGYRVIYVAERNGWERLVADIRSGMVWEAIIGVPTITLGLSAFFFAIGVLPGWLFGWIVGKRRSGRLGRCLASVGGAALWAAILGLIAGGGWSVPFVFAAWVGAGALAFYGLEALGLGGGGILDRGAIGDKTGG